MAKTVLLIGVIALLSAASGCATYEYDLVSPPDFAGHIGSASFRFVNRAPLIYRLRTYANRLVMQIENPTSDPITLVGAQSTVVDPDGQSHPLPTQTIAPASYIKLVLPPLQPYVQRVEPALGFGFGYGYEPYGVGRVFYGPPRYYAVIDENALYWEWPGQTDVRLMLTFDQSGKTFRHEFTFHRQKM